MAFSEALAARARAALEDRTASLSPERSVREKKMFGGLAFMVGGHMAFGVMKDRLMVRVGPDAFDAALALPHAVPMDFTGRPMKGMLYVDPPGVAHDDDLGAWIDRTLAFVTSMPPK